MGLSVGTSPELAGVKNVYVRLLGAASVGSADERAGCEGSSRAPSWRLSGRRPRAHSRSCADRPSQREKGARDP